MTELAAACRPATELELSFSIPITLPLYNVMLRMHWARQRALQRQVIMLCRQALGPPPWPRFDRCRVTITRYSMGTPDRDGLQGSAKFALDALCAPGKPDKRGRVRHRGGLGVLVDDGPAHVVQLDVIAARGRHRTDVLIEVAE